MLTTSLLRKLIQCYFTLVSFYQSWIYHVNTLSYFQAEDPDFLSSLNNQAQQAVPTTQVVPKPGKIVFFYYWVNTYRKL